MTDGFVIKFNFVYNSIQAITHKNKKKKQKAKCVKNFINKRKIFNNDVLLQKKKIYIVIKPLRR